MMHPALEACPFYIRDKMYFLPGDLLLQRCIPAVEEGALVLDRAFNVLFTLHGRNQIWSATTYFSLDANPEIPDNNVRD